MYLGGILTLVTFPWWGNTISPLRALGLGAFFIFPGGIDGTTQMFSNRESTNTVRAITGIFLGIGVFLLFYGLTFLPSKIL